MLNSQFGSSKIFSKSFKTWNLAMQTSWLSEPNHFVFTTKYLKHFALIFTSLRTVVKRPRHSLLHLTRVSVGMFTIHHMHVGFLRKYCNSFVLVNYDKIYIFRIYKLNHPHVLAMFYWLCSVK